MGLAILITNGVLLSLVYAAVDGREPAVIRALSELDNALFLGIAFVVPLFFGGTALAAIPTGAIPRVLGWAAAVIALLFLVGLLGLFSEDDEGGPLGILVFIGFFGWLLWVLATSIVLLLRKPDALAPASDSLRGARA